MDLALFLWKQLEGKGWRGQNRGWELGFKVFDLHNAVYCDLQRKIYLRLARGRTKKKSQNKIAELLNSNH